MPFVEAPRLVPRRFRENPGMDLWILIDDSWPTKTILQPHQTNVFRFCSYFRTIPNHIEGDMRIDLECTASGIQTRHFEASAFDVELVFLRARSAGSNSLIC